MRFQQSVPKNGSWELTAGDKRSSHLQYGNGSETLLVPNIWYNQPVQWRIEAMHFYAARFREGAQALRKFPANSRNLERAAFNDRQARRLDDLADHMAATGKVLA